MIKSVEFDCDLSNNLMFRWTCNNDQYFSSSFYKGKIMYANETSLTATFLSEKLRCLLQSVRCSYLVLFMEILIRCSHTNRRRYFAMHWVNRLELFFRSGQKTTLNDITGSPLVSSKTCRSLSVLGVTLDSTVHCSHDIHSMT